MSTQVLVANSKLIVENLSLTKGTLRFSHLNLLEREIGIHLEQSLVSEIDIKCGVEALILLPLSYTF